MKIFYDTIKNEKGEREEVTLTPAELWQVQKVQAQYNDYRKVTNSVGYEINITTLTTIMKKITEQKFFTCAPADFLPVRVGEGAWSTNLVTYRAFDSADDFSAGNQNMGTNSALLASADTAIDSVSLPVTNWAKSLTYSIMDLEQAAKSGNWDLVSQKEVSRKRNFDLGIQQIAFLGAGNGSLVQGLLNQNLNAKIGSQITINTTLITAPISSLEPADLSTLLQKIIALYQANNGYTAMPNRLTIPQSDFLGMAAQTSPTFPIKSILQVLEDSLKQITKKPDFKVQGVPYADASVNGGSNQLYALYNSEETSLRMDIPVDYGTTLQNSINNFQFQNVGYAQYTGVLAYRPAEMMYFQYPAA